ncbi:MAG: 2-hydroxychromene-2-carboxylate isomerase [Steroidobacteraceae bacterium]
MADPIDFWFSVGSTYTYLTVMRLAQIERVSEIPFRWRPFSVRAIMKEMNNIPFGNKPIKAAYMWRDIERRAEMYGVPIKVPAPYPLTEFDLANRVAIVGVGEGWCSDYVRATYCRWFQLGQEAGSEPNISDSLREIKQEPERVLGLANSSAMNERYEAATDEARKLQIFGVPTFVVRGERFWGDDRLEDAVSWHKHGRLSS